MDRPAGGEQGMDNGQGARPAHIPTDAAATVNSGAQEVATRPLRPTAEIAAVASASAVGRRMFSAQSRTAGLTQACEGTRGASFNPPHAPTQLPSSSSSAGEPGADTIEGIGAASFATASAQRALTSGSIEVDGTIRPPALPAQLPSSSSATNRPCAYAVASNDARPAPESIPAEDDLMDDDLIGDDDGEGEEGEFLRLTNGETVRIGGGRRQHRRRRRDRNDDLAQAHAAAAAVELDEGVIDDPDPASTRLPQASTVDWQRKAEAQEEIDAFSTHIERQQRIIRRLMWERERLAAQTSVGSQSRRSSSEQERLSAPVPAVAWSILSLVSKTVLLPRGEEVQTITDSLMDQNRQEEGGLQPNPETATACSSAIRGSASVTLADSSSSRSARPELFDNTRFITVVHGIGGTGKTTLAAMTVSREDVRTRFRDGVGWIKLGQRRLLDASSPPSAGGGIGAAGGASAAGGSSDKLAYDDYIDHLRTICRQLDIVPPEFDEVLFSSGDDERIRNEKTRRAMENAQQDMTNLFQGRRILLVLDDLWHAPDLGWFSFANRPSSPFRILVTTRVHVSKKRRQSSDDMEGNRDRTTIRSRESIIRLGALKEGEAVKLLLNEAGRDKMWTDEEKRHALKIARCCDCLPVAVRSVGRLLSATSAISVAMPPTGGAGNSRATFGGGGRMTIGQLAKEMSSEGEEGSKDESGPGDDAKRRTILETPGRGGCASKKAESDAALYNILNRSFSPDLHGDVLARAMKVCFATLAVVFARPECHRPWIPTTAIHLLWDGIIEDDERVVLSQNLGKSATAQLLEKMEALGLVDFKLHFCGGGRKRSSAKIAENGGDERPKGAAAAAATAAFEVANYRVHHDMMLQYAWHTWEREPALRPSEMKNRLRRGTRGVSGEKKKMRVPPKILAVAPRREGKKSDVGHDPDLLARFDLLLVCRYEERRSKRSDQLWDGAVPDDGYVFEHLPRHMAKSGKADMCQRAFHLLRDEGFMRARMMSMGVDMGTRAHVSDVERLKELYPRRTSKVKGLIFLNDEALLTFETVRTFLKRQLSLKSAKESTSSLPKPQRGQTVMCSWEEVGEAFVGMGVSLQKQSLWLQALDIFWDALDMFRSAGFPDDHPDVERTHLHANESAVPKLVLVQRGSAQCIKFRNAARLRAMADREAGTVPTERDAVSLELSSHPGLGVVLTRPNGMTAGMLGGELYAMSIGSKESSIRMCVREKTLFWMPRDNFIATSCKEYYAGDSIVLTPYSYCLNRTKWPGSFGTFEFVVNVDDTISPKSKPDLAFGIGSFPLVLVPRNSPTRFIFKYGRDLREKQLKKVGHVPTGEEGIPLELSSHPGCALSLQETLPLNVGAWRYHLMVMGPAKDAIRVSYDGRIIASSKDGAIFALQKSSFQVGAPIFLFRGNSKTMTRWKGGVGDFVINDEGSISPMHARNLALGCPFLGKANDIITAEQKLQAEEESKLRPRGMTMRHTVRQIRMAYEFVTRYSASNLRPACM